VLVFLYGTLSGCTTFSNSRVNYDDRNLTVQTLSLFDQVKESSLAKISWRGDWVFRRERLELIDSEMRSVKPDVVMFQSLVERGGSPSESDKEILASGALEGYGWDSGLQREILETGEQVLLANAVSLPLKIAPRKLVADERPARHFWSIGDSGGVLLTIVETSGQPTLFFNVDFPERKGNESLWYGFLQERIEDSLRAFQSCSKRMIIGGYLPKDQDARRYNELLERFNLKDSSTGFCQNIDMCLTGTPMNDIYMATMGDDLPTQDDRILVSRSTLVLSSSRNFVVQEPNSTYAKEFGLTRMWATQRFGWATSLRLANCGADDIPKLP